MSWRVLRVALTTEQALTEPRPISFSAPREQADKIAAKERYAKLHAAGKVRILLSSRPLHADTQTSPRLPQTDEARADLGRLAEIRKQREQAAARRKAETDGAPLP